MQAAERIRWLYGHVTMFAERMIALADKRKDEGNRESRGCLIVEQRTGLWEDALRSYYSLLKRDHKNVPQLQFTFPRIETYSSSPFCQRKNISHKSLIKC